MDVALRGSSPAATTAAILLMTKARQLGMRLNATLVGDPEDIGHVFGPAVVYSPVLASCGVGRELGSGATVVVPGAPGEPLMVSVHANGTEGWFLVDRQGAGHHPATEGFARLSRDPRLAARGLAKDLRRAMEALGMSPDTAILDVLFGAPVGPYARLSLALRAGRAITGGRGEPITRFLSTTTGDHDPLPPFDLATAGRLLDDQGAFRWISDGLSTVIRDQAELWVDTARGLAREDGGRDLEFLYAMCELASHVAQLPPHSMLPPLGAAEDAVACGIKAGLHAEGEEDANAQLTKVFRFLGGKYASSAEHVVEVGDGAAPPPPGMNRWRWFCEQALVGRDAADTLWPQIVDPPQ